MNRLCRGVSQGEEVRERRLSQSPPPIATTSTMPSVITSRAAVRPGRCGGGFVVLRSAGVAVGFSNGLRSTFGTLSLRAATGLTMPWP